MGNLVAVAFYILGALGFVITSIINWNFKKNELIFIQFFEKKVEYLESFVTAYYKYEVLVLFFFQLYFKDTHKEYTINDVINLDISRNLIESHANLREQIQKCGFFFNHEQTHIIEEVSKKINDFYSTLFFAFISDRTLELGKRNQSMLTQRDQLINNEIPTLFLKLRQEITNERDDESKSIFIKYFKCSFYKNLKIK